MAEEKVAEEKETSGDAPAGPFSMAAARGSVLSANQPRPAGPVLDGPMPKAWQQSRSWPQTPGKVQSSGKGIALRLRPAVSKLQAQAQAYVQAREAEQAEQMSQEKESDTGDSLYVKGLPAEATMDSVKDLFAHYGHVKSVRMLVQNAVLRGVPESIALVVLESAEDAEWIRQKLDGNIPFGLERAVSVQYKQPKGGIKKPLVKLSLAPTLTPSLIENNSTHVYLKGLPPDVDDNFIRRTFELFGAVEVARVLRNSAGHCAGIGFVRFSKHEVACEAAKKMLGLPMSDGTPLYTSLNPDSKFQSQRPQSTELQRQLLQMRQAELSKKDPNFQVPSYARAALQQQQAQQAQLQQQQQQAGAYAQLLQQQALATGAPVDMAALAAQGQHPAMYPPQMGYPFQMVPGQPPQPQDLAMLQQQYLQQYLQQQYLQQYLQAQQQAQQAQQQAPEAQQQLEAPPPEDPQLQYMQQQQQQPQEAEAQAQQGYGMQAGYGYEAYPGQAAETAAPAAAPEAGDGGEPPNQCPSLVDALEEGKEVAAANAWGEASAGDWAQTDGSAGAQAAAEAGWTTQGFKRPGEEGSAQEPPAKQARMPTRAMEWVERQEEFFPGAPPLPEGWVRAKARSSGKTYYLRLRDTHTTYNINEVWRAEEQRNQKASE